MKKEKLIALVLVMCFISISAAGLDTDSDLPLNTVLDSDKAITSFALAGLAPTVTGIIDEDAKTVALTVPYDTDITVLASTITHTGASISPDSGEHVDFTNKVIYRVTAEDSSTLDYTVTVTVAEEPSAADFGMLKVTGYSDITLPTAGSGKALNYDGINDYITIPYSTATRLAGNMDYTISMWFLPKENKSMNLFQQNATYGQQEAFLRIIDGKICTGLSKQSFLWQRDYGNIPVQFGQWNHVAMIKEGDNLRTYVNGVKDIDVTVGPVPMSALQPTIGASFGALSTYFFNGCLDEIQLWNVALPQSLINEWMYSGIDANHPNYENLVLYYKLNEGSGTLSVSDEKGSYNGTMTNMSETAWVDSNINEWLTNEDESISGYLFGSHIGGTSGFTYEIVNPCTNGTAVISTGNGFTYTPNPNVNGSDAFTYQVKDSVGNYSDTQSVSITINPVNDPPEQPGAFTSPAAGQFFAVGGSVPVSWGAATDIEDDPLTYTVDFYNGSSWLENVYSGPDTFFTYTGPFGINTAMAKFRVKASDASWSSGYSECSEFIIGCQYTVSFNSNGGSAVVSQTVNYRGTATEPATPTRTGYTFAGWYKEALCQNRWNFATDKVLGEITLYAKWNNTPPLTGGDTMMVNPAGGGPVSINEDTVQPETPNIRLAVPTLSDPDGVVPNGIRIMSVTGGTLQQGDGTAIILGSTGTVLALTEEAVNLRFTPDSNRDTNATFLYVVVDPIDNGLNSGASTATIPITPVNDPPELGITIGNQIIREDETLGPLSFTVNDLETPLESLSVSGISSNPDLIPNGNLVFGGSGGNRTVTIKPNPNKTGNLTITVTLNDGITSVSRSFVVTVYAEYSVIYNGNGNTGGSVPTDSTSYRQGQSVIVLGNTGNLVRTEFTFAGWSTETGGTGITYQPGDSFAVGTADVQLYAKWVINQYTVTFNSNGGTAINSQTVEYNTIAIEPTKPTRSGYIFKGWYIDSEFTNPFNFTTAITDNVILYAKWFSESSSDDGDFKVVVNGKTENVGKTSFTRRGEATVVTITVDEKKLQQKLEQEDSKAVVTIPVPNNFDVAVGALTGQMIKSMEIKDITLEIKTNRATYTLPASQINIDAVSQQIGAQVALKDIQVKVEIAEPTADMVRIAEDTANRNNCQIVVKPVEFVITCTSGDKTIEVSRFNDYVERIVPIPEGIEPGKITTGVIVNKDGTFAHVPTRIVVIDGKYYAKINSLTNSTYSVIWNPVEFKDVENHWAKEAVNDMGSRMVISGVGNDLFEPGRDITRAEFAAIIVRALGLKPGTGSNLFLDVGDKDWYCDSIKTAAEYKLISGYGNGKFGPMDKMSREQAMAIIARAMTITGIKVELASGEVEQILADFQDGDKSADYAKNSIAACVKAGIVSGKNGELIAAKNNISRAEVAVIIQRLLQKANLI